MSISTAAVCRQGMTTIEPTLHAPTLAAPRSSRWIGWAVTALPALFLAFDASIKLAKLEIVAETSEQMGIPAGVGFGVGWLMLVLLVLYLVPRTALLGAVLLTGYLGGAVALHLRIGSPLASHTLFPIYVGAMVWAGLLLRDPALRRALFTSR
jgi:hypothetical protein